MNRVRNIDGMICDGCGVEIAWAPVVQGEKIYCCQSCAQGRACECDYPPEDDRAGQAAPEAAAAW